LERLSQADGPSSVTMAKGQLAVVDAVHRLEIMDLLATYVEVIDDDRLEEWPQLFVEDCLYKIVPRENMVNGEGFPLMICDNQKMLRDRVTSLRHANIYPPIMYRHFMSAIRMAYCDSDTVEVAANYLILNTDIFGETHVFQTGRYQDVVVKTPEGWRFKSRIAIYDTARVQTLLAFPV
jgi:anthranilate 1,2-dioxygenase small subunit